LIASTSSKCDERSQRQLDRIVWRQYRNDRRCGSRSTNPDGMDSRVDRSPVRFEQRRSGSASGRSAIACSTERTRGRLAGPSVGRPLMPSVLNSARLHSFASGEILPHAGIARRRVKEVGMARRTGHTGPATEWGTEGGRAGSSTAKLSRPARAVLTPSPADVARSDAASDANWVSPDRVIAIGRLFWWRRHTDAVAPGAG
jgi:hypothetical protein